VGGCVTFHPVFKVISKIFIGRSIGNTLVTVDFFCIEGKNTGH
jgi:hypothetical protein